MTLERFTLRRLAATVTCLLGFLSGCSGPPRHLVQMPTGGKLRLDSVTIVDTRDGTLTAGMSVVMDRGWITEVRPTGTPPSDPSVRVVDASGKFVVPGYNDMHSHVLNYGDPSGMLALLLAHGVTGFRQMSGSAELLKERRQGTLPVGMDAPALLATPGTILTPFNAGSAEDVLAEIGKQKNEGADFIKVGLVTPAVFFAAMADAKRVSLPILGHLQEGVDAAAASRAGFRSVEHLGPGDTIWIGCSTAEAELRADAARNPLEFPWFAKLPFMESVLKGQLRKRLMNPAAFANPADIARLQRAFDTYSAEKCRALAGVFVANDTWQVPTLVRLRSQELAELPEYSTNPDLRYVAPDLVRDWREVAEKFRQQPEATRTTLRSAYDHQLALARLFDDTGVQMMTGTDNGGWEVPGQSLHQEFDELAHAGLSPLRVLQMTTLNPARFLGRTETMGTVAAGKRADLVLLDANPLESVQNMHRISGVVRAGFFYSRTDLDALLRRVGEGRGRLAKAQVAQAN
jgi:imidazolonepropionase-like amidohydrolase